MAKDYAKYSNQPKHSLVTHGWRKRLLVVILLILLLGTIGSGFVVYKKYADKIPVQTVKHWVTHIKSVMIKNNATQPSIHHANDIQTANAEPEIKFNFYNELPNMQVSLPDKEKKEPIINKKLEEPKTIVTDAPKMTHGYVVQLGAYESQGAASQVRVSLLLSGIEVDVVEDTTDNQPVYRIQQGPFASVSEANAALKKLKKKGVDGIVKKIS